LELNIALKAPFALHSIFFVFAGNVMAPKPGAPSSPFIVVILPEI
jgi:hypothetical protein